MRVFNWLIMCGVRLGTVFVLVTAGCAEVDLGLYDTPTDMATSRASDGTEDSAPVGQDSESESTGSGDRSTDMPSDQSSEVSTDTETETLPGSDGDTDTDVDGDTDTDTDGDIDTDTDTLTDTTPAGGDTDDTGEERSTDTYIPDTEGRCTPDIANYVCGSLDLCVDGYCCNNTCDGECEACNLPGNEGTCTPIPEGDNPDGECGACRMCNGLEDAPACIPVPAGEDVNDDCASCRVCNGDADDARCVLVESGLDPLDECTEDEATSCGQNGTCDGQGGCALYDSGTVCDPVQCADARIYVARCDGTGTCVADTRTCGGYLCENDSTCLASCAGDVDCLEGYLCVDGVCTIVDPLDDGEECVFDLECASDTCADRVCCNSACGENCFACDLEGTEGVCTAVPVNTDPKDDCPACYVCGERNECEPVPAGEDYVADCAEDPNAEGCGLSGLCDGNGGCAFRGEGYICGDSVCADVPRGRSELTEERCDGDGICRTSPTTCGNFLCADDTTCFESCETEAECIIDIECSDGFCVSQEPIGTPCVDWFECASGNCVDGFCCETACDGACERCDNPAALGSCLSAPDNTDLDGDCPACEYCVSGQCDAVPAGEDPKSDCARGALGECAQTGACDGAGECQLRADDYLCGSVCMDEQIAEVYCDGLGLGQGACNVAGAAVDCDGNLACDPDMNACPTSCLGDANCVEGYYCDADNACVIEGDLGDACTGANACASGLCVDGVCCDTECVGECEACNNAGELGTCTPIPAGTDPDDECQDCWVCGEGGCEPLVDGDAPLGDCTDTSDCGHTGHCTEGACDLVAPGERCGDPLSCGGPADAPVTTWNECDGAGACEPQNGDCGGYLCESAEACGTSCVTFEDCVDGFACNDDGQCTASNPTGTPCQLDTQCASEMCVDGFCCGEPCDGVCETCGLAGDEGTCVPEPSGTEDGINRGTGQLDCGLCEVCDGAGACRFVNTSTYPEDPADPNARCLEETPTSCGQTGICGEGTGECDQYDTSIACDESCESPGYERYDWHCDGDGACVIDAVASDDCPGGYTCLADESDCRASCTLNSHCVGATHYCSNGSCTPKGDDGDACDNAVECLSNN